MATSHNTYILGLGCNLENRLPQLRNALQLIKKVPQLTVKQVSPLYVSDALLPENAPASWDISYFNCAVRCESSLSPYELLAHTKNIERTLGRVPGERWGPRIIDIDILACDELIQYDAKLHIPHEALPERPFALWPLADVAPFWIYPLPGPLQGKTAAEIVQKWGSRFDGNAPFHTRQIAHRIDTPQLVGILNLTPDSFSDGGKFSRHQHAIEHAKHLVESGAEILDVGAEATNPMASGISSTEEWGRLQTTLDALIHESQHWLIKPKISIDTRHADIAQKALVVGVDWINDVSGFDDPDMIDAVVTQNCDIVVMHHLGIPVDKTKVLPYTKNPVEEVLQWATNRLANLEKKGISRERIIFDVGIGFGKTAEQSLALIQHIKQFESLGTRLLVGHSRKKFIGQFTDKTFAERDVETAVLSLFLAGESVDYLRVHDIEIHARMFKINGALAKN